MERSEDEDWIRRGRTIIDGNWVGEGVSGRKEGKGEEEGG